MCLHGDYFDLDTIVPKDKELQSVLAVKSTNGMLLSEVVVAFLLHHTCSKILITQKWQKTDGNGNCNTNGRKMILRSIGIIKNSYLEMRKNVNK
jgi:hypothetical protein